MTDPVEILRLTTGELIECVVIGANDLLYTTRPVGTRGAFPLPRGSILYVPADRVADRYSAGYRVSAERRCLDLAPGARP